MSASVIIPSIGCSPLLEQVVRMCSAAQLVGEILVLENQTPMGDKHKPTAQQLLRDARLLNRPVLHGFMPGRSLYEVWNAGARCAAYPIVVILNDDIKIHPQVVDQMVTHLLRNDDVGIVCPDYGWTGPASPMPQPQDVNGTFRMGGISGFAFATRAELVQVDTRFTWWGGDDDLVYTITRKHGLKARKLLGAPVEHPAPETSGSQFPELLAATGKDRELLMELHGEAW